jgi:hypothetical protein
MSDRSDEFNKPRKMIQSSFGGSLEILKERLSIDRVVRDCKVIVDPFDKRRG